MKNKKMRVLLLIGLLSMLLVGSEILIGSSSYPVFAISKKKSVNSQKFQKVELTKQTYIRQIYLRVPNYRSTLGYKTYLAEGDEVYIFQTGADFGWYLKIPGDKGIYTVLRRHNDYSWFKLCHKSYPVSQKYRSRINAKYESTVITKKTRVYRLNKHKKPVTWDYYDLEKNYCIKVKRASHGKHYHWDILWTYDKNNKLNTDEVYTTKRNLSDISWFENDD